MKRLKNIDIVILNEDESTDNRMNEFNDDYLLFKKCKYMTGYALILDRKGIIEYNHRTNLRKSKI